MSIEEEKAVRLRYECIWDAICDTPEEAAQMRAWSQAKLEERRRAESEMNRGD